MIKVENLTKRYAGVTALNGLSFEVKRGEIVGFLGQNGAGKSTTMRILTGFIPASSGTVTVAGFDVFQDSLNVRRHIGYMPENNPLYVEMRVSEYLKFRARIKGVPRAERRERLDEVLKLCGLEEVRNRIIGQLSKGFRQRVGLADALLAEPDLLILDEPTIGLDPIQIRQVRELIKDLGKRHTILISSHILTEIEMTCNRVILIHHGRILASDTAENLRKDRGVVKLEIRGPLAEIKAKLSGLPNTELLEVRVDEDGFVAADIEPKAGTDPREEIFKLVAANNWTLRELHRKRTSLEDIFVQVMKDEDEAEEDRREGRGSVLR
jgi:ABC-2 type transport system ATP-binding protein